MVRQPVLDLFRPHIEPMKFDGTTYQPETDEHRLSGQMARVWAVMQDGAWRTLSELQAIVGGSEAGISARLRDLRKARFGGHQVDRRYRGAAMRGLYEYAVRKDV